MMCGLFGAVGTSLNSNDIAAVKELGFLSALRGMDSTGVGFAYRKHGKKFRNTTSFTLSKSIDTSVDFLYNGNFDKILNSFKDVLCIMGHTRAATVGNIIKENAHPFLHDHIIGAHNGHIPKWDLEQKRKNRTDSERLIQEIADKGPLEALELAGEGAHWGLSYLDSRRNELVLTRNDKRPLAYLKTKDQKKIFWASDPMFLELVKMRFMDKIEFDEVEIVAKHEALTWHFGNARFDLSNWPINYNKNTIQYSRMWQASEKKAVDNVEDAYFKEREAGEYPFKDQEDIELARAKALPMLARPVVEVPSRNITPINKWVEALKVTENSVETACRVFDGVPWNGYPEVVLLNEHRKVLQFVDHSGKFVGKLMFAKLTGEGCMLSGKWPTMDDKIWWLGERTFVLSDHIDDPLVQDEIKSKGIVPRFGQGIYVSPRLLFNANHKKEDEAINAMSLARQQLHDFGRWMFDPALKESEDDVECH